MMNQSRTLSRLLFFVALILCPLLSVAQMHNMVASYLNKRANGGNLKWYQRYELGYSLPMFNATYTHQYSNFDPNTNVFSDTTFKKKVVTKGYGAHAGFYIPVASVGENTILAIPIHVYANAFIWSLGDVNLGNGLKYNYD